VKRRRALLALMTTPVLAGAGLASASEAAAQPAAPSGRLVEYNVLAADGASSGAAAQAVRSAGGKVERSNASVGLLTVKAPENGFTAALASSRAVSDAARVKAVGHSPDAGRAQRPNSVEHEKGAKASHRPAKSAKKVGMDPLGQPAVGAAGGPLGSRTHQAAR